MMRYVFLLVLGFAMCEATAMDLEMMDVTLAKVDRPASNSVAAQSVTATLVPEAGPGEYVVSFGVPFPPNILVDHTRIWVQDERGEEIPVFTRPLAHWWLDREQNGLRSVLVQFEMMFADADLRRVTVSWDRAPKASRKREVPTVETQFVRADADVSYRCPKVLAILPPEWMCQSWIAWQQVSASANSTAPWYDTHMLDQFPGSLPHINEERYAPHLYDRPATYAKIYIRHGLREQLLAGLKAGDVYVSHMGEDGSFGLKSGDFKYVYAEGSTLLYLLTGDDRFRNATLKAGERWAHWSGYRYTGEGFWTERHTAFGMAAFLNAYMLTGDGDWLDRAAAYYDGVYAMQSVPLDGKVADGAWRHTAESHGDGDGWSTSPWMSALLCDSIWQYWMLTGDARAPESLAAYAKFIARYAVTPDGAGVYYMAASPEAGMSVNAENPPHHVEACYMLAMGYYFSGGKDEELLEKYESLWPLVMDDDANRPPRKFAWRFRNTSMLIWFLDRVGRE